MRVEIRKRRWVAVRGPLRGVVGVVAMMSVALLSACGQTTGGVPSATATSSAPTATATATVAPTPTITATPTRGPTASTCQPDSYGIYSDQTSYVTTLTDAPLSAPPRTKHGIGSAGDNGTIMSGGESGVCTLSSFASVTGFYDNLLPAQGWQYAAPPAALDPCYHGSVPAKAWWKGSATFSWYNDGAAGSGSVFWSYTYCVAHG